MVFTGIGPKNREAFGAVLPSDITLEDRLAVGVINDFKAAAAAVFYDLGDAVMLEYLFVDPKFRRQGIARELLERIREEFKGMGAAALHAGYMERSEDLGLFFKSMGFSTLKDGEAMRIPLKAFLSSKAIQGIMKGRERSRVESVVKLTSGEKKLLSQKLAEEELDEGVLNDAQLDPGLSLAALNGESGAPEACMLCEQKDSEVVLLLLANFTHDPANLMDLFRAFQKEITARGLEESELLLVAMNETMTKLLERLCEEKTALKSEGAMISAILEI